MSNNGSPGREEVAVPRKPARARGLILGDRRTKILDAIAKLVAKTEKNRMKLLVVEQQIASNEAAVAKAAAKVAEMAAKVEAAAAWARGAPDKAKEAVR